MRRRILALSGVAVGAAVFAAACSSPNDTLTTSSRAPETAAVATQSPPTLQQPAPTEPVETDASLPPETDPLNTETPLTEEPSTEAPSTELPSTQSPSTEPPTQAPTTVTATTSTTKPAPPSDLGAVDPPIQAIGSSSGKEAARVQKRLLALGFWVSGVDGQYGLTTRQAVMAFQKYHGIEATGRVGKKTAAKLSSSLRHVAGKTGRSNVVEVDKDRQVLIIVKDGAAIVLNTSTGSGQYYREENKKKPGEFESGRSITTSGSFRVYRQRPDGWWEGDLGKIYRPKYFNGGKAVHGSGSIPNYPASHGCVRVSTPAMDMIWDKGLMPKGVRVIVYGADPKARNKPPKAPPTTKPPKTTPPKTTPPKTKPPKTSPPKTKPPKTTPPKTKPPKTSPPTTKPPKTSPPSTQPPSSAP